MRIEWQEKIGTYCKFWIFVFLISVNQWAILQRLLVILNCLYTRDLFHCAPELIIFFAFPNKSLLAKTPETGHFPAGMRLALYETVSH
jgi:hypothetical protein